MKKVVVLIGPMGCGKSTVGRLLAERLSYEFIDTDTELVKRTGVPISTIFEIEGEAGFRHRETKLIEEMSAKKDLVVATGGGVILRKINRKLLQSIGVIIYLKATEDVLFARLQNCKDRPLLQKGDRRQVIRKLLKDRSPLYKEIADLVVSTDNDSVKLMVNKMLIQLKKLRARDV